MVIAFIFFVVIIIYKVSKRAESDGTGRAILSVFLGILLIICVFIGPIGWIPAIPLCHLLLRSL